MSQDLAISTGMISKGSAGNTCCMLPGAEFLSPKFWKRTEAQYSISRSSFCGRTQSLTATHSMPHKDANAEMFKLDSPRDQQQSRGQSVANPMGDRRTNLRETLKAFSNRTPQKIDPDAERIRGGNAGVLDGASLAKYHLCTGNNSICTHFIQEGDTMIFMRKAEGSLFILMAF
ncbi:unnamed protein product [Ilex paraguariensis]|uniref:Uncharacterized protein n=1 Tax=Ilex paraguariensis TaxID=185542 RepID=A0ABC8TTF7_9AQUA